MPSWWNRFVDFVESISLERSLYGNNVQDWLMAVAVAVVALFVLRLLARVVRRRAASLAERTESQWAQSAADLAAATKWWFLFVAALYVGTLWLTFPQQTRTLVDSVAVIALVVQAGIWGNVLITFAITNYVKTRLEEDAAAVTTIAALGFVGKLVLWSVVGLLILDNLGVDVTALIAGLGVGGIAVALAAQNILGDLFASLSIVLDKPFVLGDFIIVDKCMGTVENIGLKTTRIRSLTGEQLVFSNNDLLQSRIRNYKRMQERRIVFSLGVTYQTPLEKLEAIPRMIKEAIESQSPVRFDRAHFKAFGDFALIFEAVYYVLVPDYAVYMDIQQAINLQLYKVFETEGIQFAYPTQTVFVHRQEPSSPQGAEGGPG